MKCQQSNIIYPKITKQHSHFYGITENTFKDWLFKHKNSFKCDSKRKSNYLWEQKTKKDVSLQCYIKDKTKNHTLLPQNVYYAR